MRCAPWARHKRECFCGLELAELDDVLHGCAKGVDEAWKVASGSVGSWAWGAWACALGEGDEEVHSVGVHREVDDALRQLLDELARP